MQGGSLRLIAKLLPHGFIVRVVFILPNPSGAVLSENVFDIGKKLNANASMGYIDMITG